MGPTLAAAADTMRRAGGEPDEGAEHQVEPVVASGGAAGQVTREPLGLGRCGR